MDKLIHCIKCDKDVKEKAIRAPYTALYTKKINGISGYAYGCVFCNGEINEV